SEHGHRYDVLLCLGDYDFRGYEAPCVLVYGGESLARSTSPSDGTGKVQSVRVMEYRGEQLPLYCGGVTFAGGNAELLADAMTHAPAVEESQAAGRAVLRVGYDLVAEVRYLLTNGQPLEYAGSPTLDLHISLLRRLLRSANIAFLEVPPVPAGHAFVACLTHDVDHPFIRNHRWDHTMFGFLYRATLGTVLEFVRGRTTFGNVVRNWVAAAKLPLVHLGLADDLWGKFDRYTEIERNHPSTFFVIPFKNTPGRTENPFALRRRGAAYGVSDVVPQIKRLIAAGCEVGLHGIDAWTDTSAGTEELEAVRTVSGTADLGVRMHWLFFDQASPMKLDLAGANYDSTAGYNESVGFRAGTHQIYKPLNASELLELPLHIMDTALFYPSHLHLSRTDARVKIEEIINSAPQHGGCVTVNWHDRSIAPERLWTAAYSDLIKGMEERGAWFATGSQAVSWFRRRRSIRFERGANGSVEVLLPGSTNEDVPGFLARTHAGHASARDAALQSGVNSCYLPRFSELQPSAV
ncbi:MAG TPA: hypothetical protein VGF06_00415, partial [Terriglobales bacterium]